MKFFDTKYYKKERIILLILFIFSIFTVLIVGESYDEGHHLLQGKITLNYLLSLGRIDQYIPLRENYSTIYWSFQYLITTMFPLKFQVEIAHLVNLFFSISTIYGIGKISEKLFNKSVGKLVFLILFFFPVFFGHMGFNGKDTILAFCHVWITYIIIKYIFNQTKSKNKNIFLIALLSATGTGIQLVFLGSLVPLFLFLILEILFFKKFIPYNFSKKIFLIDVVKCFLIFYLILIIFWIDAYENIFLLPYKIILETLSSSYWTGWPYNLVNGIFYNSNNISKDYLIVNFIFKTPEYVLILYLVFLYLIFKCNMFYLNKFKLFYYKLFLIISFLIFPNIILFIIPYPIYDGYRLFLWTVPYLCIVPALSFYYLLSNLKFLLSKVLVILVSGLFLYHITNFFLITPYQYTYLNILNGKKENRYSKFENDYWGVSIKELIDGAKFDVSDSINFATCGVNPAVAKKYLKRKGYKNFSFGPFEEADYTIMTNRVILVNKANQPPLLLTCFDRFKGDSLFKVKRNGLYLSLIKKNYN